MSSAVRTISVPKGRRENMRWRMRALRDGAETPGAARQMIEQCREDILFWVNTFAWTYDPRTSDKCIPFTTYGFQDKAILQILDAIRSGRDVGIKKSRDMGASWVNLIVPLWMWQFHDMSSFLLVSRNEDYVDAPADPKSLFWKIDFLLKHQPKWLKPRKVRRTSMHIGNEDNGSVIDGESTTGEVARGDRRTAILLDEFAAFETKAGYNALAATQSATNCRIFNSTPKGMANAFYDVIHKSAADIVTMHWSEHPDKGSGLYRSHRDEASGKMVLELIDGNFRGIVEVRRKGLPGGSKVAFPEDYPFVLDGKTRSPWYDLQCARAVTPQEIGQELDIDFLGSDYQFFDPVAIERYREQWCFDPKDVGELEFSQDSCEPREWVTNGKGHWSLFECTADGSWDEARRFVIGVDVSAGTGASNSTMAVYDRKTNEKVAEYANPNILPDDFGRLVVASARWFNDAYVVPDRSGPTGEVFVARMLSENYTNIYVRRNTKKFGAPKTDEPGVWLNPQARTTILQQYRDAISHASVVNRSSRAMEECMRFVCRLDGTIEHSSSANATDPSGARSNHGDIVIADALAVLALTGEEMRETPKEPKVAEGSVAWRMREERMRNQKRENELGKAWKV